MTDFVTFIGIDLVLFDKMLNHDEEASLVVDSSPYFVASNLISLFAKRMNLSDINCEISSSDLQ